MNVDTSTLSVKDLQKKERLERTQDVKIYNPDTHDFTVKYAGKPYTAPALKISTFKKPIAEHIKKHLANHIFNKKGFGLHTNKIDEIIKKIEDITLHDES